MTERAYFSDRTREEGLTVIETQPDQITISGDRFDLRPPRFSDEGLLAMYAGDPRVARMTRSIPHPLPPGATAAFLRRALAPERLEDVWIIDGSAKGLSEVMGLVQFERMDRDQSRIGYWVAPAFWNTGLATGAVGALIEANPQRAATIFAEVFQDNPNSARVLTNCGFDYLGDAEAYCVARETSVPTWTYTLRT